MRSVGFGQVYLRSNDFGVCGLCFFCWLSLSTIETKNSWGAICLSILGGGFKYFLFSSLFGEDSQFD